MTDGPAGGELRRALLGGRRLYLCTGDREDLEEWLERCLGGGVDVVQFRPGGLGDAQLVARAQLAARVCAGHGVPFILNERPDLAAALEADGVHLDEDCAAAGEARRVVGPSAIVGLSTHDPDELTHALGQPVDYVSVGPVLATATEPDLRPTGLAYVTEAARRCAALSPAMPFFVAGHVRPETVEEMVRAGARRFITLGWLSEAADPARAAEELAGAIDAAIDAVDEFA